MKSPDGEEVVIVGVTGGGLLASDAVKTRIGDKGSGGGDPEASVS
jgi:hypothetical protein